jgi:hypothetical protein
MAHEESTALGEVADKIATSQDFVLRIPLSPLSEDLREIIEVLCIKAGYRVEFQDTEGATILRATWAGR